MLFRQLRVLALTCPAVFAALMAFGVLTQGGLGALGPIGALVLRTALADPVTLDGPWSMTALTETFSVRQWSGACGPAPVSQVVTPAGVALLHWDRGSSGELVIEGPRRIFRTDGCLDSLSTLVRDAHSSDGHTFRTRCTTPPSDPRHAVMNSAYFLTGPANDTLTLAETGIYEFTIEGARCVADVSRQASLRRQAALAAPSAGMEPSTSGGDVLRVAPGGSARPNAAPAHAACSSPSEPARLEVRPSRKLLGTGDRYAFRAIVLDENGCATGTPIRWSLGPVHSLGTSPAPQPVIDSSGHLALAAGDFADASFDVIATAAGRSAHAAVEVTSPGNFEALLAGSGLDPNGERDEPAVAVLATSSIGAANVFAEDGAHRRRLFFIAIIAGLSLCLAGAAVVAAARASRARRLERAAEARHQGRMMAYDAERRSREEQHAAQMRAHIESVAQAERATARAQAESRIADGPMFCPSCRREFVDVGAFCPYDSNRLVSLTGHETLAAGPVGGVCPTCRRGFNPGVRQCPNDGDELVPASMVPTPTAQARGKICPTCGCRFEGVASFCGQDGTQLVLLN